jgi:hypothetical protein
MRGLNAEDAAGRPRRTGCDGVLRAATLERTHTSAQPRLSGGERKADAWPMCAGARRSCHAPLGARPFRCALARGETQA